MAGLYSYYLPPIILTPAQVNIPQLVNTGNRLGGWILVQNNSPYKIQVNLPGSANYLPLDPQTVDKIAVNTGDQQIYILPLTLLPGAGPNSQVDIQVYPGPDPENEPPGQYPMALSRQTAPTSGATNTGFTESFNFTTSTANAIAVNLFNPGNSPINAIFYSIFISLLVASGSPLISFGFKKGADNALGGGGFAPVPNDTLATSQIVNSTSLSSGLLIISTAWEQVIDSQTTQFTYFFIVPNDFKQIPPGCNMSILIQSLPATGGTGYIVAKHLER